MRFHFQILLISLLLSSCQSTAPRKWTAKDLIISDQASFSPTQAKEDIRFLLLALSRGYGGRNHAPGDTFAKALEALSRISEPSSLEQFRDQIDEALLLIPDNHLKARLDGHPSKARLRDWKKIGNVGKNAIKNPNKIWEVRIDRVGKKKILYISITGFPPHEDKVWNGFLSSVSGQLKFSDSIIIDMRGNYGGDDKIGMQLAALLFGHAFEYPVSRQYRSQTPEALALLINSIKLDMIRLRSEGAAVPSYFVDRLREASEDYDKSTKGLLPAEYIRMDKGTGKRTDPITGYTKPIFILMDKACGSSCETTIDAFEWHDHVKRVGENTEGCIHFGNIGYIILPNSKIEVQIPTLYNEYFDYRFIEKIGIAPDIGVPPGEDAYEFIKKMLEI